MDEFCEVKSSHASTALGYGVIAQGQKMDRACCTDAAINDRQPAILIEINLHARTSGIVEG
jgi:hypothetical protein